MEDVSGFGGGRGKSLLIGKDQFHWNDNTLCAAKNQNGDPMCRAPQSGVKNSGRGGGPVEIHSPYAKGADGSIPYRVN